MHAADVGVEDPQDVPGLHFISFIITIICAVISSLSLL